jgi:hypothetical protein
MSKIDTIVKEAMYGLGSMVDSRTTPTGNINTPLSSGYTRTRDDGVGTVNQQIEYDDTIKYNKRYNNRNDNNPDKFQYEAKDRFTQKLDTFLSIPPSRGKTDPIIGGFRLLLKRYLLKRLNYVPILLYIVPRRQLAGQISTKDVFEDIVLPLVTPHNKYKSRLDMDVVPEERTENLDTSHLFRDIIRTDSNANFFIDCRKLAEFLTAEITGGNEGSIRFDGVNLPGVGFPMKPIIIATYEKARKYLSGRISHIVVDEVQELVPHPGESIIASDLYNTERDSKSLGRYQSLTEVLKKSPISTSITLMTGSVNDVSVKDIANYFNSHYARQFKVVPDFNPERPALNRSAMSVQPLQEISGYSETAIQSRIKLCKEIIVNKQNKSLLIIFSKGLTGQGIFRIIQEIIKIIPPRDPNFVKNIIKNDINDSENIKGKEGLYNIQPSGLKRSINEFEYLKYFDVKDAFTKGPESKNSATEPDENNILYQGVLRGISVLYGNMDQDHKKTVQKLFINDKIQILLATDALGVGANVKCRYLYIPTITKFTNGRLSKTDESSLTQLVHRAGRGSDIKIATIFCAIEDFEYINNLVFNDPRSAVPGINPYLMQDLQTLEKENGAGFVRKILAKTLFKKG